MNKPLQPVNLTIHGKEYRIACADNERDSLVRAAQLIDQQMRQIHETGKVSGNDKIAVMAALNIAHELNQNSADAPVLDFTDRLVNLRHKIESVLDN